MTRATITIMEDIGQSHQLASKGSSIGRTVDVYKSIFAEQGFQLRQLQFLNTKISRWWYDFLGAFTAVYFPDSTTKAIELGLLVNY